MNLKNKQNRKKGKAGFFVRMKKKMKKVRNSVFIYNCFLPISSLEFVLFLLIRKGSEQIQKK